LGRVIRPSQGGHDDYQAAEADRARHFGFPGVNVFPGGRVAENTLHAIVTGPPYGVKEYDFDQLENRANGNGGRVAGAVVL